MPATGQNGLLPWNFSAPARHQARMVNPKVEFEPIDYFGSLIQSFKGTPSRPEQFIVPL